MEKTALTAKIRTITGRKVKKLRQSGLIPANLFGKNVKSLSLEIPVADFLAVYKKVGETGLVELKTDKDVFHTLISKVQTHPINRAPVHAEFHAVSLTEKIKAHVPVELIGESQAVKDGVGLLLQTLSEVEVEALPTDLPEKIEVDVAKLVAVGDQVVVADIKLSEKVAILTPGEEIVVKVVTAVSEETKKEEEKKAAEEAAKAATETPPTAEAPASSDQAAAPAPENS